MGVTVDQRMRLSCFQMLQGDGGIHVGPALGLGHGALSVAAGADLGGQGAAVGQRLLQDGLLPLR